MMGRLMWLCASLLLYTYCGREGLAVAELVNKQSSEEEKAIQMFVEFVDKYDKPYKFDTDEYKHRFEVFKGSLRRHKELNRNTSSTGAVYGITKFSDLTPEEFKAAYLNGIRGNDKRGYKSANGYEPDVTKLDFKDLPKKVDWRDKHIISPVKNQLHCGACWAFSSVETVESMYALSTGEKVPQLSVQEVIDCAAGNLGCDGGDTCSALDWMIKSATPLVPDTEYPLTDKSQFCKIILNGTSGVFVKDYTCLRDLYRNETKVLLLLANVGPVTVSVDATTWNDYQGGIIQYHCRGATNNHAVQIVGYDLTGEIPYYIVRNSWGTDFGNAGYLYVKYGGNVCGISREVSTVTV
ncbi:cathepsin O-like [Liolophura sinensis]|uniref:cathepsin O-like n=1 Tax=Liolophura sinensis TaxID=3198878 RepID=UPI003158705C